MTKRAVIITTSILVGLVTIFTILFGVVFRVRDIRVVCGKDFCYRKQIENIIASSQLKKKSSIFSINRSKISNNIEVAYPYARVDSVSISNLTSIKIKLSNRKPLYYVVEEAVYYILDEDCKILEVTNDSAQATQYIALKDVFSVSESTQAGQFLDNNYTSLCGKLYKALYSNAMLSFDNGTGGYEDKYLEREDMYNIIRTVKFAQVDELDGKMDNLIMTTSYGTSISIIEPQQGLDLKINMAFSALRTLIERGNGEEHVGTIVIRYSYNGGVATPKCEYHV